MNLIKEYISNFLKRSGGYVFLATIFSRGFSFLASWFAIQFIPNKELGIVLFAYNIVLFIIPFADLGLHQSLIRFGTLLKTTEEKKQLFNYVFRKGFTISFSIVFLVVLSGFWLPFKLENTGKYLSFLAISIIPVLIMELIKIQFRLQHNNKLFSFVDITFNTFLVVLVMSLGYFFQADGYVFALITAPLLTVLIFFKKTGAIISKRPKSPVVNNAFWKYGFFAGLTSVVSNLLLIIDVLVIGFLLTNPEMVTNYRYISIIPLSLLFLPRMFMAADFVTFTERIFDRTYIFNYIKSYLSLFFGISVLLCVFSYFFAEEILSLIDKKLIQYSDSFLILIFGVCGILIFRGIFGNLLCSIGKIQINYYINLTAILINVVGNYYLIPVYGIKGATITSAFLMWFTGFLTFILFLILYKKINQND